MKRIPKIVRVTATTLVAILWSVVAVSAQSGGGYDLTHNAIAGGGATFSTSGGYSLGGTIGQLDAGTLSAGIYQVNGGFWPALISAAPITPTVTATGTRVPTQTPIATQTATMTGTLPTRTATVPVTVAATASATVTTTPATPTRTGLPTATPTPSATPTPTTTGIAGCTGDCDGSNTVTVDELVTGVNIALGNLDVTACSAFDADNNQHVTVDELVQAVNNALNGCQ